MKYLILIGLIILCLVFGFYFNQSFIQYSFALLNTNEVILENGTVSNGSYRSVLFPIVLSTVPLVYLLLLRITDIKFLYRGVIATLIIVGFGILFWRLRIFGLNVEFETLSNIDYQNGIRPSVAIDYLKFEVYLLMGFIVGTLISILFFRDKTKSLLN